MISEITEQAIVTSIKNVIKVKGFKQKAVAERAGFNQRAFSDMLHGRKTMKAVDMAAIARALDVTPNELFGIDTGQKSA